MADVYASNWSETDASNNSASPDGMPEGMAPSGVNDWGRAAAGAIKRYVNQQIPKTTGGTSTAYTLSYSVAPGALVDGMTHLVQFNAANGAAATLNVNSLGAQPLRLFGGALLPGCLVADQIVQVRYNSSAGVYEIIPQDGGWVRLGMVDASAASTVDFTGIPAGVNNLMLLGEATVGTNASSIGMQTYGTDAGIDTGGSDYSTVRTISFSATTSTSTATGASIGLSGSIDSGTTGWSLMATLVNIQASTYTKVNYQSQYTGGAVYAAVTGSGSRNEADRITGIRLLPSAGNFTGKFTLLASK